MGPKSNPKTEKVHRVSDPPIGVGRQRACNTIKGKESCLLPHSGAENVESMKI